MKYFLDTEFHEHKKDGVNTIELISIGIVSEEEKELYLISCDFDVEAATENEWLLENVLKPINNSFAVDQPMLFSELLKVVGTPNVMIADQILEFIGNDKNPEFYAYFADYDWVVFCWLFGRMIDLPKGFPMYCRDLKQMMDERQLSKEWKREMCPDPEGIHNALVDAKWNLSLYKAMNLSATAKVL